MIPLPNALLTGEVPCAGAVVATGNARADVAEAMGRAEAGERVTALLAASQLPRIVDLVQDAARRLLPLVMRVAPDGDAGGNDAGAFAIADTGACVLCAAPGELPIAHLIARLLAERALLPVVLLVRAADADAEPAPLPQAALELLGEAADFVSSRTPAQELLFGKDRRRVVRWFDLERPVLRGQRCDQRLHGLQQAGFAPFVQSPVAELLRNVAADVQLATGIAWSAVDVSGPDNAEVLVVGCAGVTAGLIEACAGQKPRVGVVTLNSLRPWPASWLAALRRKRALVVLADAAQMVSGDPPLVREVRAALLRQQSDDRAHGHAWKDKEVPALHVALLGPGDASGAVADIVAFVRECAGRAGRPLVYLGVVFAPLGGSLRKRTVLHEALRRAHPGIERLGLATALPVAGEPVPSAPRRVPAPARLEPTHDSVTRSWDVVGAAAISGADDELAPDPYLTAGSVPALTSLFRANRSSDQLPAFAPESCTGCGACWAACPDSALLPAVMAPRQLLDAGMRMAAAAGGGTDAAQPLLSRLAKHLPKAIGDGAVTAGAAIAQSGAVALAKLDEARRPAAQAALAALAGVVDALPIACPAPFFAPAARTNEGGGDLFALALDPDACKGCNLCVAVCAPAALTTGARSIEAVARARRSAEQWRALPDTPGRVIAVAREQDEPGLASALQLSRHCLSALAPGDECEPGSGARIALRGVLAAAEAHLQPRLQQHLHELDELSAQFGERIREQFASALPTGDLDALHEGLVTLGMGKVALSQLAARLDEVSASGRVDAPKLQRLVDTARAVADLRWRVGQGTGGRGRARTGLVLTGGDAVALAERFPWNPFAAPALLDGSPEAGHRALGLLRGAATAVAADFALLRRARALLAQQPPAPRELAFDELTAAERALFPPLWLVADAALLRRGGLAQLTAVLDSDLPIKVLLLVTRLDEAPRVSAALLALAHRRAFVLQSSIAHRDHLAAGVLGACAHAGPALLEVLAPSPLAAGAAADQALVLARAAVERRAFPLLCYDPSLPGAFGEQLSLAGNPAPAEACTDDERLLAGWRTLQELAGVRTPFTRVVEARAAADVAAAHARELDELRDRHRDELRTARGEVENELLARLQHKLTTLAGGRLP